MGATRAGSELAMADMALDWVSSRIQALEIHTQLRHLLLPFADTATTFLGTAGHQLDFMVVNTGSDRPD